MRRRTKRYLVPRGVIRHYLLVSRFVVFLFLVFVTSFGWGFELPTSVELNQLPTLVRIVATGTSTKLLSNPYPLGGHPGFEMGISVETIDGSDLDSLGVGTSSSDLQLQVPRISFGKGLYQDFDVFIHFVPFARGLGFSEFGSLLRWSFFETNRLPINTSLIAHGNHMNFDDKLLGTTLGIELNLTINVNKLAVYFGGGHLQTTGQVTKTIMAAPVVANDRDLVEATVQQIHTFIGLSIHQGDFFLAAQIDRYPESVFSAKLGLRH